MSGFIQRVKALFSKTPKQGPAVQRQPVYQQQPQPQSAPQPQYAQQQPQPQLAPQPQYVQQQPQPQFAPQPQYMQQPVQYMQQPVQYMQQPQYVQHQQQMPPQYMQQPMQQPSPFGNATQMPNYFAPSPSTMAPNDQNSSIQANNMTIASATGIPLPEIERFRHEFNNYANRNGVIDRDGFRRLFIASLLNTTWQDIERESESTFRRFDVNQSGVLDFNEYMQACSRMILGGNQQPTMNQY
ncbi:unnamed protein product [Adineta ricciae]|uniref:EF-hand domain-containing protein n=1 Tax=Adineta ricciae TaxID=249248 RepID=A0A814YKG2_ADIRI|nr:unnamed protein product [Adineta ricciae]CAF1230361.1 unnamed protein product [Adineta ricciae]